MKTTTTDIPKFGGYGQLEEPLIEYGPSPTVVQITAEGQEGNQTFVNIGVDPFSAARLAVQLGREDVHDIGARTNLLLGSKT